MKKGKSSKVVFKADVPEGDLVRIGNSLFRVYAIQPKKSLRKVS